MRRLLADCTAIALVLAVANTSQAQFMGGDNVMTKLMILDGKDVRKDIKLTDEQAKKADALMEKPAKFFEELAGGFDLQKMQDFQKDFQKEVETYFKDVLKPEQTKRLDQIALQQQGGRAFQDRKFVEELKLNDEQKKKFKEVDGDFQKSRAEIGGGGFDPSKIQENMAKMQELSKTYTEKYVKVLDDEQKKKWNEKVGEPFKGKVEMDFSKFMPKPRP